MNFSSFSEIIVMIFTSLLIGLAFADTGFSDVYSAIKMLTSRPQIPFFDPSMPTKLVAPSDTTATLTCKVHNLGNYTVSWIRHKDLLILSVGRLKYNSDKRYEIVNRPNTDEYQLRIHYVQPKDEGVYECQISTTPINAFYINLKVIEGDGPTGKNYTAFDMEKEEPIPSTDSTSTSKILGGPDMYVKIGDMVNLTCVISGTNAPPKHIFWYHEEKVISYYSNRGGLGGVSIITEKGDVTVSTLLIKGAEEIDEGSYICDPSNSEEAKTRVFVLDGNLLLYN